MDVDVDLVPPVGWFCCDFLVVFLVMLVMWCYFFNGFVVFWLFILVSWLVFLLGLSGVSCLF